MELMSISNMVATGILEDTGETCKRHGTPIYQRVRPKIIQTPFCIACQREVIARKADDRDQQDYINSLLAKTHKLFFSESILSQEQAQASMQNFKVSNPFDEKALNFAKRVVRDYGGGQEGNALLIGPPGTGKSHLSMAIARSLNDTFKHYNQPKQVIFVSVARLVQLVQDSFNNPKSKYTTERMTKLLTECDYLVLDDLGKESTTGSNVKSTIIWTYRFLFNILDNRTKTIINSNFSAAELRKIYDDAFVDRVKKGALERTFVFPADAESKRN